MQKITILVTGGAGFIGSNFVRYVFQSLPNVHVVVFDLLTYAGCEKNLADVSNHPHFSFIQGDICDANAVTHAMQGCNMVVHFAAETHVDRSITKPDIFIRTNVQGTFILLEVASQLNIERFIYVSTDEVYGNAQAPDGASRPSLESDALRPLSPYAASKAGADCLAFSYWKTFGLPVVVTRCGNNYGPYQHLEKQIPLFITHALAGQPLPVYGDGRNTRSWTYVSDHCAALAAVLVAPANLVVGEVFNIGTEEERTILENAQAILDLLGLSENLILFVPDRPGHVYRHAVEFDKIRERLGWTPQVSFQEGLKQTIAWYRYNAVLPHFNNIR